MKTTSLSIIALLHVSLLGCAVEAESNDDSASRTIEPAAASTTEDLTAGAPALPPDVEQALRSSAIPTRLLDRLFTLEHFVRVGNDRTIHVTETFSLRAFLRWPHRALLMLPGPLTTGAFYNIEVEGYRGRERVAQRGFFALSADFEGTGQSSFPADGRTPTQDLEIAAIQRVIQYFRATRFVPSVDLLGESWAGGVAAELCADRVRVRSCTLASMLYKTPSDFANMTFRSPEFLGFLNTLADGYLPTVPDTYFPIIVDSPPEVQAWTRANLPGRYTTVPLYDVFDLPFFDPTVARVPGLIIQGELDPNQSIEDAQELARDYGKPGAKLVVVPGAGHIPRVDPAPKNEIYWTTVENFIDP